MAGTRGDMVARIISDLRRPDTATLTPDVVNAINDAITIYQKQRLRFNVTDPANPPSFPTVAGRFVYDAVDNANIPTLYRIDWVRVLQGNTWQDLDAVDADELLLDNQNGELRGTPSSYGYTGNKLVISAVPDAVYTIRFSGHLKLAAPANNDEQNNPWMLEGQGERLIRSRAQYILAVGVLRNAELAKRMSPRPPNGEDGHESYDALQELRAENSRVMARGVMRPTQF